MVSYTLFLIKKTTFEWFSVSIVFQHHLIFSGISFNVGENKSALLKLYRVHTFMGRNRSTIYIIVCINKYWKLTELE